MSCRVRNGPRGSHHSAAREANFASSLESTFAIRASCAQLAAPAFGRSADLCNVETQRRTLCDEMLARDPDVRYVMPRGSVNQLRDGIEQGTMLDSRQVDAND